MGVASGVGTLVREILGFSIEVLRVHRATAKVVREFRHVDGGGSERIAILCGREVRERAEVGERKSVRVDSGVRARWRLEDD